MKLPDWATHIAMNADGSVYAFSGEPGIFEIDTGTGGYEEVWEPMNDDDIYQFIERRHPDLLWRESVLEL